MAVLEEVSQHPNSQTKQESGYDIPIKKTKMDDTSMSHYLRELYPATLLYQFSQLSRQQPWLTAASSPKHIIAPFGTALPYLSSSQEPPLLQNPERVVRHTENERFDRSYQPNVALAPRQTILAKEREQREYEKETSTVIKRETIQIKQERPSTPNAHELSPELRHNSPETTVVLETNVQDSKASVAPISPENQSGSNEITSSTSPVPATPSSLTPNKQESISPPHIHHRSHHHHMINSSHHLMHHKKSQSSSASPPTVVVKMTNPQLNGIKKMPLIGNPEFELSTDTDEESLGEPDSSNHVGGANSGSLAQTPSEFVAILLKNNSLDDHKKILDLVQYMEKDIAQSKEAHKKEIRELQQIIDEQRKENELLKVQLSQQHKMSVIATASCLSSSSSSSSSSLSSNSSFDFDQQRNGERRNSIVAAEKPNVIIKPPKKSMLRITPLLLENDCKATANNNNNNNNSNSNSINQSSTTTTTPSIVMKPKCEDIMNNNNTKMFNNNNSSSTTTSTTTSVVINGNQQQQTEMTSNDLQKTAIKTEKL
ncbi:hypothetical protein PVAND_004848 [Polypedilum vanderplanki]|uniref:Uncharacterized protein n=1 Tax=Polypedilum vanderplanki TaxID=319348 RepID=A0A9J6BYH0_POLVA|nr:hypothetical protein PVAND_004848 [Polypedilum vanderplanki]